MSRRWALVSSALAVLSLAACESDDVHVVGPKGHDSFDRYVAMGTSVSMGTQSDGIVYFTQVSAWPAQLARAASSTFTQPLISTTPNGTGVGCPAPLIAPLSFSRRYGTQGASLTSADLASCSPLFSNITLPAQDVAIDGARAYTALYFTPDSAINAAKDTTANRLVTRGNGLLYSRVLPTGQTQVTTMLQQKPTLVSVEFGANELLGVSSGILFPSTNGRNGSYVPLTVFQPIYDKIIDSVKASGAKGLLVAPGISDVSSFPLFRKGSELAAETGHFIAYGVVVAANCSDSTGKDNLISMTRVLTAVGTASATKAPATLSCANTPGTQDGVLTPGDVAAINTVQADLSSYIKTKASQNGYAYMELGSLYNTAKVASFNADSLLKSVEPYGPLISLDGVHPSGAGHKVLARAAATALNSQYGFDIVVP